MGRAGQGEGERLDRRRRLQRAGWAGPGGQDEAGWVEASAGGWGQGPGQSGGEGEPEAVLWPQRTAGSSRTVTTPSAERRGYRMRCLSDHRSGKRVPFTRSLREPGSKGGERPSFPSDVSAARKRSRATVWRWADMCTLPTEREAQSACTITLTRLPDATGCVGGSGGAGGTAGCVRGGAGVGGVGGRGGGADRGAASEGATEAGLCGSVAAREGGLAVRPRFAFFCR